MDRRHTHRELHTGRHSHVGQHIDGRPRAHKKTRSLPLASPSPASHAHRATAEASSVCVYSAHLSCSESPTACFTAWVAMQLTNKPAALLGDVTTIVFPYPQDAGLSALVICNHAGLNLIPLFSISSRTTHPSMALFARHDAHTHPYLRLQV